MPHKFKIGQAVILIRTSFGPREIYEVVRLMPPNEAGEISAACDCDGRRARRGRTRPPASLNATRRCPRPTGGTGGARIPSGERPPLTWASDGNGGGTSPRPLIHTLAAPPR
jgi:hypothetical protein